MKAHDVRHLAVCPHCDKLGDNRRMVRKDGKWYHGRCAIALVGLQAMAKLPGAGNVRLDDIGLESMKALLMLKDGEC